MFKNYLLIASRNLRNSLVFSAINIFGLSLGIACCMVVSLFVIDQYSYDAHHEHADNIYRIANKQVENGKANYVALTPGLLGTELPKVFPEILKATRLGFIRTTLSVKAEERFHESLMAVDDEFFSIFTIPISRGAPIPTLTEQTILISETASKQYFGGVNPIGKTIYAEDLTELKIAGVFKDFPYQTHLYTDFIVSFSWVEKNQTLAMSWNANSQYNYVLMQDDVDMKTFNSKMNAFILPHVPKTWKSIEYFLQPLLAINLSPGYAGNPKGTIGKILIVGFGIVGGIILLLACLNYMNLATARSAKRATEVGLRKVMGAFRTQIIGQFLAESLILCLISFFLAILWADMMVPAFNAFTGLKISMSTFWTWKYLTGISGALLMLAVIAGSYPAFFLSRFVPAQVLKGKYTLTSSRTVRRSLVIFQFTITSLLAILVTLVWKQTNFMRTQDLGFRTEALLLFETELSKNISPQAFKEELYKIPGVTEITIASDRPGARMNSTTLWAISQTEEQSVKLLWAFADANYISTLGLKLVAGENFKNDSSSFETIIVNENAAASFGWTAEEAIGKQVAGFTFTSDKPGKVAGVIKDFHISPLRKEIMPLVIGYSTDNNLYMARLDSRNIFHTRELIAQTASKFSNEGKVEPIFMEEALENNYAAELKTGQLLTFFTMLALVLGCSGLYALSAYEAEQRIKELGIRKIMGASSSTLLWKMSENFLRPIFIALAIGMPLAYFLGNIWLRVYPYRVEWSADIFVLAGAIILIIAQATVLAQAFKASRLNPVDALRYE